MIIRSTRVESIAFSSRNPDDFVCVGILPMVPEYQAIAALRVELVRIAEEHGGKYDGWQTSLVE